MATTSKIAVSEGSGKNVATYSFTEDAVTKEMQRVAFSDSSGNDALGKTTVVAVTLSLDTSAYAAGDLLADTQALANAVRINDYGGVLQSLTVVDKDDQGVSLDVYILDVNVSLGTENAAPSITDPNAVNIIAIIPVVSTDYRDLGGVRVASYSGLGLPIVPAAGTRDCYVAVVNGTGTPTFTASGVVLNFGILQD